MTDYTFTSNNKEFSIALTRRKLNLIPEEKNAPFDALSNLHRYDVQSQVSNDTLESFLNYWAYDKQLQITSDNFIEFYQLEDEFGILGEIINQPEYKQFNDISILIRSADGKKFDKSCIEKKVTLDLDNYLTNSSSSLKQVPLNSLYNIFNHPERNLNDHDLAYNFIIDAASEGNELLYILLESLDSDKMKLQKNKRDCIVNYRKHQKYSPQNSEKYIFELEKKLENAEQEQIEKTNNTIKSLNEEKEELLNKLKEQKSSTNDNLSSSQKLPSSTSSNENCASSNSSTSNSNNNHSYYRTLPSKTSTSNSSTTNSNNNHSYYRKLPSSTPPTKMEQIISKAKSGDLNSQYQAGLSFIKGFNGFPMEPAKGIPYIKLAADGFHPEAAFLFAKILLNANNYLEAIKYFEIAVKKNNEEALVTYGEILCTGFHVCQDIPRGVKLLKAAMQTVGDAKSLMIIGVRFYKIHTVSLLIDARTCFKKGAGLNDPQAIFNYAYMLERGEGGEKDVKRALDLYLKAAQMNSTTALVHLGEILEEGRYMDSPQLDKALELYCKAKSLGSEEAVDAIKRVEMKKRQNQFTGFRRLDERDLIIGMLLKDFLDI